MLSQREKVLVSYVIHMVQGNLDGRRTSNVVHDHFSREELAEVREFMRERKVAA